MVKDTTYKVHSVVIRRTRSASKDLESGSNGQCKQIQEDEEMSEEPSAYESLLKKVE